MEKGQYTRHRENQREQLLNTAEDLFIKNGIEAVTIIDIAQTSNITRPTLYKYFSCKEDMAIEIFKTVTSGWAEDDRVKVWSCRDSGYATVEKFIMKHIDRMFDNIREASFIAEFNYLYAKHWTGEQALEIIRGALGEGDLNLRKAVQSGQADGSIRADISIDMIIASIFNLNSGLMNRIGELGPKLDEEFSIPSRDIFIQIAELFLKGLRG